MKIKKITQPEFENTFLEKLDNIPDCPKELFYVENLPPKNIKSILIVGSRSHSSYAKEVLEKIFEDLQGQDILIISGLALGVDSLAHKLALKYKLPTMTVPGSGLSEKVIYPRANIKLAKEILNQNGYLLSEFEPEFKATN